MRSILSGMLAIGGLLSPVRQALDAGGHRQVRTVVPGGFNAEKIRCFEDLGVPHA